MREARHTIIRLIRDHLRLDPSNPRSWQGRNFDFTGATFDGGDFSNAVFSGGWATFDEARFAGDVVFEYAQFTGGTVSFLGAQFTGGTLWFTRSQFTDGPASFSDAQFTNGQVTFQGAQFTGSVTFAGAEFTGGVVIMSPPSSVVSFHRHFRAV